MAQPFSWRLMGALLLLFAMMGGVILRLVGNARAMPVVRHLEIALPFPKDAHRQPITLALMTDTHVGPENSPERMARIVDQVNALKPDLVVLGGDYIADAKGGGAYGPAASIAPFARLRARLGVVAVLGNHDSPSHSRIDRRQWHDLFAAIGIRLLDNQAVRRGPLALGGLRDIYTGRPDIPGTLEQMQALGGVRVVLSHGPEDQQCTRSLGASRPRAMREGNHVPQICGASGSFPMRRKAAEDQNGFWPGHFFALSADEPSIAQMGRCAWDSRNKGGQ